MITALAIPAPELQPGDVIHLEPHMVNGQMIGHRTVDVEVTETHRADWREVAGVVVEWRGTSRFPGGDPAYIGATVYEQTQTVPVLSRPAIPAATP